MMVKIIPPKTYPSTGVKTVVQNEKGEKLDGIHSVTVHLHPDELVRAELTVLAKVETIWAEPFMSEESFLLAAKHYGYDVKKRK